MLQETVNTAISTGPKGLVRGLQVANAVTSLTREYILAGTLDPPPRILRKLFERLGSTYIKLGQFVASSPSLFPEDYVEEFQKCLDKTEPIPYKVVEDILNKELKQPLTNIFSSIDPTPLASASIAQVHAARLKDSNKQVVVKVLKPQVEDVLITDLTALYLMSKYIEFIEPEVKRLSLTPILEDIRTSMLDEVDFTKEAKHIQDFSLFLDKMNLRSVATCPYVYRQYSTKRVLTMERLSGVPLTDLDAIRSVTSKDPETVLINALNTWFASVLSSETFHADVHAGNLLVLPDGRVGFIDFGIVGRISPVTWRGVEALMASLAVEDYDTMARALGTIGACDEEVDYTQFARDLRTFFGGLKQVDTNVLLSRDERGVSASLQVDQQQVNQLVLELLKISETHGIRFPREFGIFLKQLLYFDRYTQILAPGLQMFSDSRIRTTGMVDG